MYIPHIQVNANRISVTLMKALTGLQRIWMQCQIAESRLKMDADNLQPVKQVNHNQMTNTYPGCTLSLLSNVRFYLQCLILH